MPTDNLMNTASESKSVSEDSPPQPAPTQPSPSPTLWPAAQAFVQAGRAQAPSRIGSPAPTKSADPPEFLPQLLHDIRIPFKHYLYLSDGDAEILALYVLFTHTFKCHRNLPRLLLISPAYGCGKTTTLELLCNLVREPSPSTNITEAVMFREVKDRHPTLILDEGDTWLKGGNSQMAGIFNAGFGPAKIAVVKRVNPDTHEVDSFNVFTPLVVASRGKQLEGGMVRRTIQINMEMAPLEVQAKLPAYIAKEAEPKLLGLKGRCERWAKQAEAQVLALTHPTLPDGLKDRDKWLPLFRIAQLAGGDWAAKLPAIAMSKAGDTKDEDSVRLLRDLKAIFDKRGRERLHTYILASDLEQLEDAPWEEKWAHARRTDLGKRKWLAEQLKGFGVKPEDNGWREDAERAPTWAPDVTPRKSAGTGGTTGSRQRGYSRAALQVAWERYRIVEGPSGQEKVGAEEAAMSNL